MGTIDEIKERLPIEQLVGESVALKRTGQGFSGLCPFHNEKTPSFTVSPSKGIFYCFGCQAHGDIFGFMMRQQNIEFGEALGRLAERTGVTLESEGRSKGQQEYETRLLEVTAAATLYFQQMLAGTSGGAGRAYLRKRDVNATIIAAFGLGFAPDAWDTLTTRLRGQGFSEVEIVDAGLAVRHAERGTLYDRFRNRVMFPIRDAKGRVRGFGGRVLDSGEPKYLNSPQGPLFDKGAGLFAIDLAQESIKALHEIVLVEGYMDAVRAHQAGFSNVVATLGTSITPAQVQMANRLAERLVLALDGDRAGQRAATRAGLMALSTLRQSRPASSGIPGTSPSRAVDLRVATLPEGLDPDDLIARDPPAWQSAVAAAVSVVDHYFTLTAEELDPAADDYKQRLLDALLPVVRDVPGLGMQQTYLERLAQLSGVATPLLRAALEGTTTAATERRSSGSGQRGTLGPTTGLPGSTARNGRTSGKRGADRDLVLAMQRAAEAQDPLQTMEDALLVLLMSHLPIPAELIETELGDLRLSSPGRQILFHVLLEATAPLQSLDDVQAIVRIDDRAVWVQDPEVVEMLALAERLLGRIAGEPVLPLGKLPAALRLSRRRLDELRSRNELALQSRILGEIHDTAIPDSLRLIDEQMALRHTALRYLLEEQTNYRLRS